MSAPLQFWFDFASTYSYVAAQRIEQLAEGAGLSVEWRPFIRGVYEANFAHDEDISDPALLSEVLEALGLKAEPWLAKAQEAATKQALRGQTAEASRLGLFGAPNFVVNGELFFGQDRLEDAIAWAKRPALSPA